MYFDQPDLLRLKREMFHVEIRRQALETKFAAKRTPTTTQHYPIEKFIALINKLIATQTLDDDEYTIVNSFLDDIQYTASNDPEKFSEYAEHLRIVKTLLDSMCLTHYPQIAMKASNCFQNVVARNNHKIYVDEHLDKAYAIYRSWLDCPHFQENGVRGLNHLVMTQGVKVMHDFDFVDQLLRALNDRGKTNQHGKILTLLGNITKEIQDDQQVIRILRIAAKLVGSTDDKQKIKGLKIIENATKNIQNIQFVLTMNVMEQIFDLVTYSDKLIGNLAITIICNLTFTIDKEESIKLLDLGILDVILKLLKNQQKSFHRQNGGFILANLMASDFEVIQRILDNTKLVDVIFVGMHSDSVIVRKELYHAWKNFILSCTQQQLLHGLSIGLLDYLIMGLGDNDATIICRSIEGISHSLKKFGGTSIEQDILGYLHRKSAGRQIESLQYNQVQMIYELAYQFMKDHLESDFY